MTTEVVLDVAPYSPDLSRPSAILVDIDGTLAVRGERGPYDFDLLTEDTVNEPVVLAVAAMRALGHAVVLLSGRQSEYRLRTEQWLTWNSVGYDELWMRALGDRRRDDVVKAELFDRHVRDRWWVRFVLDDRDRVVRLWRSMGLSCWQVAPGDF